MKNKNIIKEFVILVLLLLPIIFMFFVWNRLPDYLPTHWNIKGEIDGYGPKYFYPLLNIFIYIVFIIIPKIDPRKRNYTIFSATFYKLRLILVLFASLFFSLVMINSLYTTIQFDKLLPAGILFLFSVIGNYLSTVRSNWFIGIRTPWTLDNEEVWKQTHIFAGRLFFFGGIAGATITLFLPKPVSYYFAILCILSLSIITALYSYFYFRKLEKSGRV